GVIRYSTPSEPTSVPADPDELQAAFVNLLDNAVKYSGEGARITVRTQSSTLKNKVNVFIRDNGIGVPPGELKRIFKRFYRVDDPASRGTKGTGLGLAIVKSVIDKHGGKIRADSRGKGMGTTILIQLPKV
ncbi:MAG: HAMP domain-containing sensor histidine kinase, partial [Acidobacteriota bacterium]